MGCDIHLFIEKRVGDKWEYVCPRENFLTTGREHDCIINGFNFEWLPKSDGCCYIARDGVSYDMKAVDNFCPDIYLESEDIGRHYSLFSVLAGVRGSHDCEMDYDYGLPEDISWQIKWQLDRCGSDAHSRICHSMEDLYGHFIKDKKMNSEFSYFSSLIEGWIKLGDIKDLRAVMFFDS